MKLVILITVIESLAVMLAIMCFYYRRSQSGKGALVLQQATLVLPPGNYSQRTLPNQLGHKPLKAGLKI
jgi:hypothetical protein